MHPVGMLTTADGAQVLLDHAGAGAGTREQACALAGRLGGLALALDLAGRYLADARRLPLPAAITAFPAYQAALEREGTPSVLDHPGTVHTAPDGRRPISRTWDLSLNLLDDRGLPLARTLLRLLCVLADAPLPYQLLLDADVMACSPLFPAVTIDLIRGLRCASIR